MAVCPKCGANNPANLQVCRACGELLDGGVEEMDTLRRIGLGEPVADAEATPEWLQLLLAKYGEEAPALSLSTPAIAEEAPPPARAAILEIPSADKSPSSDVGPEEMPDWLANLRGEDFGAGEGVSESPEQETAGGAEDTREIDASEAAGWLSRLESASLGQQPATSAAPPTPAEDIPDWLAASLEQAEVQEEHQPDIDPDEIPVVAQDNKEIPDWLAGLGDVDETVPAGEAGGSPAAPAHEADRGRPSESELVDPFTTTTPEPPPAILDDDLGGEDTLVRKREDAPPAIIDTGELKARQAGMSGEPSAAPPPIRQEKETVPDWLAQLISTQAETTGEVSGEGPEEGVTEESDTIQTSADAQDETDSHAGQAVVEVPPWLAELNVSELDELEPADTESVEIPVSLEEMDSVGTERPTDIESSPVELSSVRPEEEPEGEGESLPDWLSRLQSLDKTESAPLPDESSLTDEPIAVAGKVGDDWLSDLEAMGAEPETTPAPASEDGEVPDWLADIQSEIPDKGTSDIHPEEVETPAVDESLERADIPPWMMKLRPGVGEEGSQLPGLPDVLPVSDEADGEDSFTALRSRLSVPEVPDVEGASLFRKIASDAAESQPIAEEAPKGSRWFATVVWALVFLILIIAIAITLMAVLSRAETLLGAPAFQDYLNSAGAVGLVGSVQGFQTEISALPEDSAVLVCVDYSPATEAEMGLLAQAVLDDLSQHQLRIMAVSLSPEGAMMAHRLIERVNEQYPEVHTVNLGYLPGNAMGIRSLANMSELMTFEGGQKLTSVVGWEDVDELADVSMMVEIADSNNSVRWWVEQQQVLGVVDKPLLAAVSASSAPASQPYREANLIGHGHLEEMISGITGAAAYEFYLGKPGRAMKGLAAQSVTHLGLVLVAVAGTIAGFRH